MMQVIGELCEDYRSELRVLRGQSIENKASLLCERLFRRYYTAIRTRLLLEVSSELGPHVNVDNLVNQPLSLIVRIINFTERLKELVSRQEIVAFEGSNGEGLDNYLCPMETFTAAIVSMSISSVEDAWNREVQKFEARLRAVRTRGGSASAFGTSLLDLSSSAQTSTRVPKDIPRFSAVFSAMEDVFDSLTPLNDPDKAAFLRRKVFTSCILFLSGNFQAMQPRESLSNLNGEDERYIGAMMKDLDQCSHHIDRLQAEWTPSSIVPEIAEVFVSASRKFMAEFTKVFVQRFFDTDDSLSKLFSLTFSSPLWANGEVTPTLVNKFKLFLSMKQEELPLSVHESLEMRLLRGFLLR